MSQHLLNTPTDSKRRAMQSQPERDTKPEIELRRALHSRGMRYRLHKKVVPNTKRQVDIVFARARVAVDVRGCFWHHCPQHATYPKTNSEWWHSKLNSTVARDLDSEVRLRAAGWSVVVVWEHEDPQAAADRVISIVMEAVSRASSQDLARRPTPQSRTRKIANGAVARGSNGDSE